MMEPADIENILDVKEADYIVKDDDDASQTTSERLTDSQLGQLAAEIEKNNMKKLAALLNIEDVKLSHIESDSPDHTFWYNLEVFVLWRNQYRENNRTVRTHISCHVVFMSEQLFPHRDN